MFFFISFAIGALCASALAFYGYSLVLQCVVGLALSLVMFAIMRTYLKRANLSDVSYGSSQTNIDALVGSHGIVKRVIKPNEVGAVKIGGEVWRAKCESNETLQEGTIVSVLRVEGNTVIVKSGR